MLKGQVKPEWQHLDPEMDGVLGISTFKAYDLLKDKKADTVIIAVIDNGAELTHEDLQGQFWNNPGEIAGNGLDDDKNGYIDDIHGWNFLGNNKGQNIKRETTELTRIYGNFIKRFGEYPGISDFKNDSTVYKKYLEFKKRYEKSVNEKNDEIHLYQNILAKYLYADSVIKHYLKLETYTQLDLFGIKDSVKLIVESRNFLLDIYSADLTIQKIKSIIQNNLEDLKTRLNPEFSVRQEIIGDNPEDINDDDYGNNMVDAQGPYHGTGVAGTIAALWNGKGINGVARHVKLMILRVLPNGDERDKDVALAIRYAVKNRAQIINCSFGKSYSSNPEFVIHAIRAAEENNVLIVHAAGNDGRNNDSIPTYPTGYYSKGKRAGNWISVGATNARDNSGILAYFSNYGKESVDVFAPGVDIPSCALGSKYDQASGTSTAAPIVSGIAAVLKSYFPKLTAIQIKNIIVESVYIPKTSMVKLPGNRNTLVFFRDLSVSGGIANLEKAIQLALQKCGN